MKKWYRTWWGVFIIIVLFPFAVPYLIFTETKYNIFVRISLSVFVFIFFVIISSMNPSEKNESITATGNIIEEKKIEEVQEIKQETPEEVLKKSEWGAKSICRERIENQLKSPKTAEFEEEKVMYSGTGSNQAIVTGYVDSQNSFGALIRAGFICTFDWNGSDFVISSADIIE